MNEDRIIKANIPFLKDRTVLYVEDSKAASMALPASMSSLNLQERILRKIDRDLVIWEH